MYYTLPTYEDAQKLCKENDCFYEIFHEINGTVFSIFNYRFATSLDFRLYGALEMRGLTFRHLENGKKVRYLMLHKFFNIGENDTTLINNLNKKKIDRIFDKLDGSMIRFVELNNGEIVAKTKLGFDNDQANVANNILNNNEDLYEFVRDGIDYRLAQIFEYTSPFNKIVVNYPEEKLTLIQIREEITGDYVQDIKIIRDIEGVDKAETPTFPSKFGTINIENLTNVVLKEMTDAEGYVIRFTDGQYVKAKTPWYIERHRLITEDFDHENFIIEMIVDEKIDDLVSILDKNCPVRIYVEKVMYTMYSYLNNTYGDCLRILNDAYEKQLDRKAFAIKYTDHLYFSALMRTFNNRDLAEGAATFPKELLNECIKNILKKKTRRLNKARIFLEDVVGFQWKIFKEVLVEE